MAETTTTPDYSLDASTVRAVGGASVSGDSMDAYMKSMQVGGISSAVSAGAEKFYKAKEAKKVQTELDKQVQIMKETEERLSQIQKDLERSIYKQRRELTATDNVLKWTEEAKKRA